MRRYARVMLQLGLLVLPMWALPTHVEAQGTVLFANDVLTAPPDRFVHGRDGAQLTGTNYFAQLYYSRTNSPSWAAVTNRPATFRPSTIWMPGTWFGGNRTLLGVTPGEIIRLQVVFWDSVDGQFQTAEQANAAGVPLSASSVFEYTVPPSPPPPGSDHMVGFAGVCCVEPALRFRSVSISGAELRFYVQGQTWPVVLERKTNLVSIESWTPFRTNLGPFWFTNRNTGADRQFFRVRQLPGPAVYR
jgi:hypothetical protein